eukprot:CAMPEP_0170614720 /NCGR_PEP_ID=MMETSP0224-20130122/24953_1 /TAXON_ID=285029 /ORGANISM="Togula jolla, Strain CCCM 725" /LENGTH=112 /DNA_ID=CAMNT_0010940401 /DNA_START=167 /DNA_END=502 /DNA_ORIENTATION=-
MSAMSALFAGGMPCFMKIILILSTVEFSCSDRSLEMPCSRGSKAGLFSIIFFNNFSSSAAQYMNSEALAFSSRILMPENARTCEATEVTGQQAREIARATSIWANLAASLRW